jgi:hypothetical protein
LFQTSRSLVNWKQGKGLLKAEGIKSLVYRYQINHFVKKKGGSVEEENEKKKLGGYLKRGNNFPARKALLEKGQQFLQNVENRSFLIFL